DVLERAEVLPKQQTIAVLVPEATIRRAIDEVWKGLPKLQTFSGKTVRAGDADLQLTSYDLELKSPDSLVLTLHGWAPNLSLDVKAVATARFGTYEGRPTCVAAVRGDVDPPEARKLIEGIATGFFMAPLDNYLSDLISGSLADQGKKADTICRLSEALV